MSLLNQALRISISGTAIAEPPSDILDIFVQPLYRTRIV